MKALGEPLPRSTSTIVATHLRCRPLYDMYTRAADIRAASWPQVEVDFLDAMGQFDSALGATQGVDLPDEERKQLTAEVQNGKGDFFNDLLALLLENCAEISHLYARRKVPGLIVRDHNLDGVYPSTGRIEFLLEAKMTGTPKTALNPGQRPNGRPGSADLGKRVKELAFKAIDLKGEYNRRRVAEGEVPASGPGGGDLTAWLRSVPPRIYCFMAVRVLGENDFKATLRWARTAQQVLDGVGLYCYEPTSVEAPTHYRRYDEDIPTDLELDRVLHKACLELRALSPGVP